MLTKKRTVCLYYFMPVLVTARGTRWMALAGSWKLNARPFHYTATEKQDA